MPQDLEQQKPVQLTESPNSTPQLEQLNSPLPGKAAQNQTHQARRRSRAQSGQAKNLYNLHPYIRPLTISDLEACVALENAAFDEERERCSREKFEYRLTRCGELSLGLFCSTTPDSDLKAETLEVSRPVETNRKNGDVAVLLAHIVATRSTGDVVTDQAMDYPKDWNTSRPSASPSGHQDSGRTICLHSLAVSPGFQDRGIGRTLLNAYLQQMNSAGIADKIALIAHDHVSGYYEGLGFTNKGASKAEFGGGGWTDMVMELKSIEARASYG